MPNLVGIGNSQVPTNGMLGGMAYQDPTNVVLKNVEPGNVKSIKRTSGLLTPYEGSVSGGEVTFVYDTSKDSDGRARVQYLNGPDPFLPAISVNRAIESGCFHGSRWRWTLRFRQLPGGEASLLQRIFRLLFSVPDP